MKTTYFIEYSHDECGWSHSLSDAKELAKECDFDVWITKIVGPRNYEGYHDYYVQWDAKEKKFHKYDKKYKGITRS